MIVEKLFLPTRDNELDFIYAAGTAVGLPAPPDGDVPFGLFYKKGINSITFGNITVLCGSSNTEKNLLLRIIASKLGSVHLPKDMSERCLEGYLGLCHVKYGKGFDYNNIQFSLITKEQSQRYTDGMYSMLGLDRIWSVVGYYENIIEQGALYILEEPENGMSLSEQLEFADMLSDFVKFSKNQFIISSNSPVLLSMKGAVIYDFDESTVKSETWYCSPTAQKYLDYLEDLKKQHNSKRKSST